MLTPMAYVLVVSEFTLPLFEACLARLPSHVLLIVSDQGGFDAPAARLRKRLREKFSHMIVDQLDASHRHAPLKGDDVIECQHWIKTELVPLLQQAPYTQLPHVLNFTGGTKAMTAALLANYAWQQLDYKSITQHHIQVFEPHKTKDDACISPFKETDSYEIKSVQALDVAKLYNEFANEGDINPLNRLADSLALAEKIWSAQENDDLELKWLFAQFERTWHDSSAHQNKHVIIPWENSPNPPDQNKLIDWLDAVDGIAPGLINRTEMGFSIPTKKDKKAKDWIKWISGTWLEHLAYHWIIGFGIPAQSIARNLIFSDDNSRSASGREADLFIHNGGRSTLIEIKAGIPPNSSPKDIEQQISSIKDRLGRSKKIILLGPSAQSTLKEEQKFADFELRCKASQVSLCLSQQDLKKNTAPGPAQ